MIRVPKVRSSLHVLAFLALCSSAAAQDSPSWVVQNLVPQTLAIRYQNVPITFDITPENFPPLAFPARYTSPAYPLGFFSSAATNWSVQITLTPSVSADGTRTIPATQLFYQLDGGPWIQANGLPQLLFQKTGPTQGWQPATIRFALDLAGQEVGGNYAASVTFTSLVLP